MASGSPTVGANPAVAGAVVAVHGEHPLRHTWLTGDERDNVSLGRPFCGHGQ
jgi:hypothetical protein